MKTLLLMRHAKSAFSGPTDFDRPLDEKGLSDAATMGRRFKQYKIDYFLVSPAKRTKETLEQFSSQLNDFSNQVRFIEQLYLASPQAMIEVIESIPKEVNQAIIIAHNPTTSIIAEELSGQHTGNLSPATIVELTFDIDDWSYISPALLESCELYRP